MCLFCNFSIWKLHDICIFEQSFEIYGELQISITKKCAFITFTYIFRVSMHSVRTTGFGQQSNVKVHKHHQKNINENKNLYQNRKISIQIQVIISVTEKILLFSSNFALFCLTFLRIYFFFFLLVML